MKLKVLVLFCVVFSPSVFAQFFPARADIRIIPGQVAATIYNPYYETIICNGQVFGQTSQGFLLHAKMVEQVLIPNEYRYLFLRTMLNNPFVNAWANINCRFVNIF